MSIFRKPLTSKVRENYKQIFRETYIIGSPKIAFAFALSQKMWAEIAQWVWQLATSWTVWETNPGVGEISAPVLTGHGTPQPPIKWPQCLFPGDKAAGAWH
jgi:hypothetical protein